MKFEAYPDQEIHDRIIQMMMNKKLKLKLNAFEVKDLSSEGRPEHKVYKYYFKNSFFKTQLQVSIHYPAPSILGVVFFRSEKKSFEFADYLKFKNDPDFPGFVQSRLKENLTKEQKTSNLNLCFEILQKHLYDDLRYVAKGWSWVNVPFDWEKVDKVIG